MRDQAQESMFAHDFGQLAVFENGRTPVLLTEVQYRRAQACVNALEGMPTERIEQLVMSRVERMTLESSIELWLSYCDKKGEAEDVTAQRDALLAAARAAEAVFARQKWREDGLDPEAVALRLLRAAIAKAEGRS